MYTKEQFETVQKLVKEFSRIDNHKARKEKLAWYDLASGIKDIEVTKRIMIDLKAI